jgi:retron-type reverse transcriptase
MLEERIHDRAFLRLIQKWLKAGILDTSGEVIHPATGTPQGGIVSPNFSERVSSLRPGSVVREKNQTRV